MVRIWVLAFHSINRDGSFHRLFLFYALLQGPTSLYFILLFLVEHEKVVFFFLVI